MKKILIAVPVQEYMESQTFKTVYDLEVPHGYETFLEIIHGDQIDQTRNQIAKIVLDGYDYLFSVDSDMSFPKDTLKKLLAHDVDIVSGIYRQRKENQILEIYQSHTPTGPMFNADYNQLKDKGLVEIVACGFGCVLIKKEVFQKIPYPHFEYHVALNHQHTVSEDVDFCMKASRTGSKIYCDTSILCDHHGNTIFRVT